MDILTSKIVPIILVLFVLFILFTRKGKNAFVKAGFGKIIRDYGEIGSSTIMGVLPQTLRIYECSNSKENFYVMEIKTINSVDYVKISHETAQNFAKIVSSPIQGTK